MYKDVIFVVNLACILPRQGVNYLYCNLPTGGNQDVLTFWNKELFHYVTFHTVTVWLIFFQLLVGWLRSAVHTPSTITPAGEGDNIEMVPVWFMSSPNTAAAAPVCEQGIHQKSVNTGCVYGSKTCKMSEHHDDKNQHVQSSQLSWMNTHPLRNKSFQLQAFIPLISNSPNRQFNTSPPPNSNRHIIVWWKSLVA